MSIKVSYCDRVDLYGKTFTNFGDILVPYILEKEGIDFEHTEDGNSDLCGIGSILQSLPYNYSGNIWSSGFIFPTKRLNPCKPPLAVRGLKSLEQFDCDTTNTVIGDGGLIISRLYTKTPPKTYVLGILPHYIDIVTEELNGNPMTSWPVMQDPRVLFIDPRLPVEEVLHKILSCRVVTSSSLHGIITCDSYYIPHALISYNTSHTAIHVNQCAFKFQDYYSSFGLKFTGPSMKCSRDTTFEEYMSVCSYVPKPNLEKTKDMLLKTLRSLKK